MVKIEVQWSEWRYNGQNEGTMAQVKVGWINHVTITGTIVLAESNMLWVETAMKGGGATIFFSPAAPRGIWCTVPGVMEAKPSPIEFVSIESNM